MTEPRSGKIDQTQVFAWSSGRAFNGYALIALVPSTHGSVQYAQVRYANTAPAQRLPIYTRVPILEGKADANTGLFYNEDIEPYGSRYVYWLYDPTDKLVSSASTFFTVSADSTTLPTLTPTIPTQTAVTPSPPE